MRYVVLNIALKTGFDGRYVSSFVNGVSIGIVAVVANNFCRFSILLFSIGVRNMGYERL